MFLVFPVDQRFRDEFDCLYVQCRRLVQFWLFVAVSTSLMLQQAALHHRLCFCLFVDVQEAGVDHVCLQEIYYVWHLQILPWPSLGAARPAVMSALALF